MKDSMATVRKLDSELAAMKYKCTIEIEERKARALLRVTAKNDKGSGGES